MLNTGPWPARIWSTIRKLMNASSSTQRWVHPSTTRKATGSPRSPSSSARDGEWGPGAVPADGSSTTDVAGVEGGMAGAYDGGPRSLLPRSRNSGLIDVCLHPFMTDPAPAPPLAEISAFITYVSRLATSDAV